MSLEFPFVGLSPRDHQFGTIPNQEIVIAQCPADVDPRWREVAQYFFNFGLTKSQMLLMRKAETEDEALKQLAYFNQWRDSLRVENQGVKLKVCAWLLSLMLEQLPNLG